MAGPNMAKKARQMRAGNRPEQQFETSSPQIGRHLSKLTGTGAKKSKAKIKGSGPVDNRELARGFRNWGRVGTNKGGSIHMPGGPASPETRPEVSGYRWMKLPYKPR